MDMLDECTGATVELIGVDCWPAPEYPDTVNKDERGNLGLNFEQEQNLVLFLKENKD
jgi:hypothetical protein